MLSRAALLTAQRPISLALARGCSNTSSGAIERRKRQEFPDKVRLGFVPEEWFQFFYKKTGVTGPYMFGVGLMTYLCSKEIYVMEHEFYTGIPIVLMCVYATKNLGPKIAAYCDKEIDKIEDEWKESRLGQIKNFNDAIEAEKKEQWRAEGQLMLIDAKKENVALQIEAAYRERSMEVYQEVKRRLDYQVEVQNVEQRLTQKHIVNWVVNNVLKSITPEQENQTLDQCISDLNALAKH